jgi:hypothetical protein
MISPESVVTVGDSPNDETFVYLPPPLGSQIWNHYVDQLYIYQIIGPMKSRNRVWGISETLDADLT